MNFKPTLWKSIVSLVVVIVPYVLLTIIYNIAGLSMGGLSITFYLYQSIILSIVIYLVWSFIQKGEVISNPIAPVDDVSQK